MKASGRFFTGERSLVYVSLILLGVMLSVWMVTNRRHLHECIASYRLRNREMARVKSLNIRLRELGREKDLLESGSEENEVAIRDRFRMVRPGERLVIVEREDNPAQEKQKPDQPAGGKPAEASPALPEKSSEQ